MKIQYSKTLVDDVAGRGIFVDSTAFINAAKSEEFLILLKELRLTAGLWTVPSVVYEYTRTSNNLAGYADRLNFIKELGVTVFNRVEELLEKDSRVFLAAYNTCFKKEKRGPSYTDSLLCTMLYKHRDSRPLLLTSNHKDIPSDIFDRVELITLDIDGELHTEALYQFSASKFSMKLNVLEKE